MPTATRRSLQLVLVLLLTLPGFSALSVASGSTSTAHAAQLTFRQKAVQVAANQKGDPYSYGAAGPNRFDCSGLTLFVYKKVGKSLVHNAAGQYRQTRHIAKTNKRPGDLIFYTSNGSASGITHVAIYAGNGYTWVARHSGTTVTKQAIYTSAYIVGRVRA